MKEITEKMDDVTASANYNEFIKAMLDGNVKAMNLYMNDIALATFGSFDVGKHASQRSQPERFYHGFAFEGKKVLIGQK